MPGIGSAPGGAVAMEDVCDLQPRAAHGRRATLRLSVSPRSAARAGRAGWSRCGSWCWRRGCNSAVVSSLAWPSSTWMMRMSVSCSSRWVAKLCRNVCGDTRFLIPAASAAAWTARLSWRVESGSTGLRPETASLAAAMHQPSALAPPVAQQFEQLRRQHGVAILAALALLDPQQHALGVDVADLERDHLGDAQTGAVGGGECRLVLRPRCRLEQQRDLLDAQHRRQPARLAHHRETPGKLRAVERHGEQEAQGRDRRVDARRLHAALPLVQLEAAYILRRRCRG